MLETGLKCKPQQNHKKMSLLKNLLSVNQAFTNCMHGYDHACNMHANSVMCTQKSASLPHRPLSFKKIKTTTITAFLIFNTVVPNPYSHSTAFGPQSFSILSSRSI